MPTKLFGGTLITTGEPDSADLLCFGQELLSGSKNMTWNYFKTLLATFAEVKSVTTTVTGTTATIDKSTSDFIILDVSGATGDVTLTINNMIAGDTILIHCIQGIISRNLIFPVGTKTVNHSGNIVTGISGADPQAIPIYYDGNNYIVQGFGEAQ